MKQYEIMGLAYLGILLTAVATNGQRLTTTNAPDAIPWNQVGVKAGADYKGDGLAVSPTESGARLHCVFQRLDGEATLRGLWLTSTVTNTLNGRFRVTAMEIGRRSAKAGFDFQGAEFNLRLAAEGSVSAKGRTVRFSRPGLTEEYSVSMDGVRQDFIVEEAPSNSPAGELVVTLNLAGAKVEPAAYGARLALENSGRKIAYSRLRVTDANGKVLPARIEVCPVGDVEKSFTHWSDDGNLFEDVSVLMPAYPDVKLAVVVDDADAVYPVRIDPTFSDANWISLGGVNGTYGTVYAAVADDSGNLFIGGDFTIAGGNAANFIAQWDGSSWSALGSGLGGSPTAEVYALAVSGGTLYVGGAFTTAGGNPANCIAQWNGSSWSPLGSGVGGEDPYVYALAWSGGTLYAGGDFTNAGGNSAANIAQWNGSRWSTLGSGLNNGVNALAVSGGTLYVGGAFTTAGGNPANCIAQWNGTGWSPLGSGLNNDVYALVVSNGVLYAGGSFTTAGGSAANCVAQWNGTGWSPLGSGLNNDVFALAMSGGNLYAGGVFTTAGGVAANCVAQWNGTSWSTPGAGVALPGGSPVVFALAVSHDTLYAGGGFTIAGGTAVNNIAQWNGTSWSAVGSGLNNTVFALALSGETLYAAGAFTTAGTNAVNCIAQWNGSSWSPVGAGIGSATFVIGEAYPSGLIGSPVHALAVSGGTLYAGGSFSTAGGSAANNIAQWNGSSWSPLALGVTGSQSLGPESRVAALAVSGGTLYVGGVFTMAGGSPATNIAQWNGSRWSPLGSGLGGSPSAEVYALAVSGGMLYAGGFFTTAGGNAASCIAQWNGSSWSPLGSGLGGTFPYVYALAVSGDTLFVGGPFTTAGGNAANCIAQWNGSAWSPLGSGMEEATEGVYSLVNALVVSSNTLYAGGQFTTAGGNAANCIAQWNGSAWSPLGSGLNNGVNAVSGDTLYVSALAVSGDALYAGGVFTTAGTNVSDYAAMANLTGGPVPLAVITTNAAFGFTNGVFGFDVSGPAGSNVVIEASTDLKIWIPLETNLLGSGLLYFSNAATNHLRFYRTVLLP